MSNENPHLGEGFGAKPHRQNDHKASGIRKMVLGGGMTVVALILGYFGIGLFVEGYQEYRAGDTLGVTEQFTADTGGTGAALKPPRQMVGYLTLEVTRADGRKEHYGPIHNLIVNAGENFLVDAFQGTVEPEILRYHGLGTSTTAPAETDTGCGTELTTQYNPDSTRATGTLTEGSGTNVFRTVATNTVDATVTIGEFCLMSQAATGGGTMWSRVLVSPTVGLNSGDSLQSTYDLTIE